MKALLAVLVLLSAAPSLAPSPAWADEAAIVLAANQRATGAMPAKGSVEMTYVLTGSGLTGPAMHRADLATGAFVDSFVAEPISGANGFDGRTPWQTDVSGVSTDQEGGDRIVVAVNEAYRNANLWWRPDRGGALITYAGRETSDGRALDHLVVTPKGGGRFDAWFDVDSHLLTRTAEPQQFFKTQYLYSGYARVNGVMLAHGRVIDFGTGEAGVQRLSLQQASFGPIQPLAAYGRPKAPVGGGQIDGERSSVTLPFRLLNNHVYVQARVNGKGPYTFIVDTGGHTLISPRLAAEIGLKTVGEGATSGAGEKTATTGFARYQEIDLGGVRLTGQPAFITEIYDKAIEGLPVDGMVGFELFARFAVRLDYGAQTMTISRFDAFDPSGAGVAVPFKFYDHLPAVQGLIDDMPARFDIDTGSRAEVDITSPFVASRKLRDRYRPGISTITGWGVGGPSRSYVVRIPSLTLGGVKTDSVVAGLSEDKAGSISDPNFEGNVGSGFLKRFAVTFDYARQTLYLKPLVPPPLDAGRFDRSGLWINAADTGFTVTAVAAGSPAEAAGVTAGDIITAIDGKPATPEGLSEARTLLRSLPAGTTVELSLIRNGAARSAKVELRDLI